MELADKVLRGNIQAAARLISLIEDDEPGAISEMDRFYPHTGKAHIIGATGALGYFNYGNDVRSGTIIRVG